MSATLDLLSPDRILRKAELTLKRRIDGIGPGPHRSIRLGDGVVLSDLREYVPGDDVRAIDWNVTARTGHPHVRVYEADREASALLVVDRSSSIAFGTAVQTKETLLRDLVAAVGVMVLRRGDRLGGLVFAETPLAGMAMTSGRRGALRLLQLLADHPPQDRAAGRLDRALAEADRVLRRRSIVVVVSDWIDAGRWEAPLRRLAIRHEVIAAELRDPREAAIPDVGEVVLEDPESGVQLAVDTSRPETRAAFEAAVVTDRVTRAGAIAGAGASHLVVSTDRDWLADLLRFLERRKRARR